MLRFFSPERSIPDGMEFGGGIRGPGGASFLEVDLGGYLVQRVDAKREVQVALGVDLGV